MHATLHMSGLAMLCKELDTDSTATLTGPLNNTNANLVYSLVSEQNLGANP